MEAFFGKWKVQIERTTGLEDYGKLFGWDEEKRKMFACAEYTVLIAAKADNRISCFLDYGVFNATLDFKLGEEFEYTSPDGNKSMLTVVEEDGKLVESYRTADGVQWKTTRSIDGDTMTAETIYGQNNEGKCLQYLVRL